jgi:YesN/AraC family two-component response regulator
MNATEPTIESNDKNLTLLVVDDEEIIRERLKDLGEKLGLDVTTANDGVDGWEAFKEVQPDLAILDIYMPRMNGLLLMHKIKEVQPDCPVILITGFLHYEQLIQKDRIKPEGFIIKPFHMEKIANLILELVEDGVQVQV